MLMLAYCSACSRQDYSVLLRASFWWSADTLSGQSARDTNALLSAADRAKTVNSGAETKDDVVMKKKAS